ncbi:MAG TPA: helicase-associated domain-containing protein [Jatrophihabitans sp.]|nr:helicase-associated domain-containing protein [Jatrophihabitans sp.]
MALLRRRPDLALPAPVDISTLANRIGVRTSINRALDALDAYSLRVLEVIALLPSPVRRSELDGWFADRDATGRAVSNLRDWALIWGADHALHPVGAVREVLGPFPAGLGRTLADLYRAVNDLTLAPLLRRFGLPPAGQPAAGAAVADYIGSNLASLLAESTEEERAILRRLAAGPPIGTAREADSPVRGLLERGLLVAVDLRTVELPREVSLALREAPAGQVSATPPGLGVIERGGAAIDGTASTAVLDIVRLAELLVQAIADDPVGQLRSGGVGVRDLRRLAKQLDQAEDIVALLLEVSAEAGLLASSSVMDPTFLPTTEFDDWLAADTAQRWVRLAAAWLGMTRQPSLVGQRDDRDKTIAALSADVERHSAPGLRRQLLQLLADLPPGQAPDSAAAVLAQLAWRAPRRAAAHRSAATALLAEAATLGITGYGAITSFARALLDGMTAEAVRAEANAADLLRVALPAAVAEFLLQPDLTVVVPGPPTPELQRELGLTADLESSGGASVYRISPGSLRRALDAGRTGDDLLRFFAERSRTPVPQALEYLVRDAATQHGRLRVGAATSYLRCDDVALLDRVLAEPALAALGVQRIAPTVLVTGAALAPLLERLRAHGYAPAAESADGSALSLATEQPRLSVRPQSRNSRVRSSTIPEQQLVEVVQRLRAAEKLTAAINHATTRVSQDIPGVTSASILEILRTAVREDLTIAIGYVDDTGTPSQRTLSPISVGGGVVRGYDPSDTRLRSYPLQRITTVSLLED